MRIAPKAQYGRQLVIQSDNTRVAKPVIERRIEYKLKPGEFFFTDRNTGKKTLIKPKNETVSTDKRNTCQRKQDEKRTQQLHRQYEEDKKWEEGMRNLQGFLTFISPSTYVGPVFNNNGKSYVESVMSGEGTGSTAGNVAIDILTPFAVGGATKVSSRLLPKTVIVYKGGIKPFINDYTFFTTDKEYAKQFGPVQKYKLKYKHPAYTEDPLIYKDMEGIHYYIDRDLRQQNKPLSDIIIGHDKLTTEGLIPSKGTEYVVWNPKQIKAISQLSNSSALSNNSSVNSDALNLHFQRLKNGGYDKLEKQLQDYMANNPLSSGSFYIRDNGRIGEIPFVRKNLRDQVSIETPQNQNSIFTKQDLENAGGAIAFTSRGMIEYSPEALLKNGYDIHGSLSHELDHALHIPIERPQGFDLSNLSKEDQLYFTKFNGTELSARGSQIKDWLKFNRADQNITENDLKNADQNYINDTGMNNKMTQFFNSISDYKKAAEWLSKYATGLSIPIILNKNE